MNNEERDLYENCYHLLTAAVKLCIMHKTCNAHRNFPNHLIETLKNARDVFTEELDKFNIPAYNEAMESC